jgi:predicted dehydrogenase
MERVKVGVVGVGWVAQVVHLPLLIKMQEVDVVAVCDREKSKAQFVAEKFGIRGMYADSQEMLERENLAAVIILTSTDAHKDPTIAALKAGKDVLVEKPIARTYSEAVEIAEIAKSMKRKLMVGMNHRFRPDTMILKSFIEGKELGKVFYTRVGWLRKRSSDSSWFTQKEKSGGGVFIDLGIVMLDMALWMMGYPDVKRVSATHFKHKTRQVEDTSLVTLTLKNGSAMNIEVSWSMTLDDDIYYCNVFGTDGSASLNPLRINKELHGNIVNVAPAKLDQSQNLFKRSYENELKHFIGAVKGLHPIISTGEEAVQRMKIVDAVYRSVRLGKEVALT